MNIKANETYTIHIDSIAFGGDGVGRIDNIVVFVPNAIAGETVKVKIIQKKKNFCRGVIIDIEAPSPNRITPQCPYYKRCGGCQYLHLSYNGQIEAKTKQIKEVMGKIGHIEVCNIDTFPSPQSLHYRNKIKLHVKKIKNKVEVGYMGINNTNFIPIESCLIAKKAINDTIPHVTQQLRMWKGILPESVTLKNIAQDKVEIFYDNIYQTEIHQRLYIETFMDKTFKIPISSFFQINSAMIGEMISIITSEIPSKRPEHLIDAYCGSGIFGICASSLVDTVVGVDRDTASIKCAQNNARANNITNASFMAGRVEDCLEKMLSEHSEKDTALILDPPRTGIEKPMIDALNSYIPETIIYVSCNPPILARDVAALQNNYTLSTTYFLDMFPQTKHCEVIAILKKR
ncbi:MAG: class I SAM-dependent RNA methyltransferase [Candidatus Ancaeobacter aquaticus]|nr:class I SAM-dependent RNA methyltransferase [Candidatus Ancaeobacter aquaticus]